LWRCHACIEEGDVDATEGVLGLGDDSRPVRRLADVDLSKPSTELVRAAARPMPDAAPVTRATLPSSSPVVGSELSSAVMTGP
jgi:hypothetical protein